MSLAEIEAELGNLTPEELRRLALKSWTAFVDKEDDTHNECAEDDPRLLAALDEAVAKADASPGRGLSAAEVRARMAGWTSTSSPSGIPGFVSALLSGGSSWVSTLKCSTGSSVKHE